VCVKCVYVHSVYVCRSLRNDSSIHEAERLSDGCGLITRE